MNRNMWRVLGRDGQFEDEALVMMIKRGELKGDDLLMTEGFHKWVRLEDTIYEFYLREVL